MIVHREGAEVGVVVPLQGHVEVVFVEERCPEVAHLLVVASRFGGVGWVMVHGEFPGGGAGLEYFLKPLVLLVRRQGGVEDEKLSVAVLKGVAPFRFDFFRTILGEVEQLQVGRRLAALNFVVADGRDECALVVHIPRVVEHVVPVVDVIAAIDEVAGHDVKRSIRPFAEGAGDHRAPALKSVLGIAHVDERKRFGLRRGGCELGQLGPVFIGTLTNGVKVGRVRFQPGEVCHVAVGHWIVDVVRVGHLERDGVHDLRRGGAETVEVGFFDPLYLSLVDRVVGAPLDGLARGGVVGPCQDDLIRLGRTGIGCSAKDADELGVVAVLVNGLHNRQAG